MNQISPQELKERMDKGEAPMLIDVREPDEREEFNIGGELIPLGTLGDRIEDLEEHKNTEIVLYCRSGGRSGMATQMLEQAGFTQVFNLKGGILGWKENLEADGASGDPV